MAKYKVQDWNACEHFEADDDDSAFAYAEEWLRTGDWDRGKTIWLEAEVLRLSDEESLGHVMVTLLPEPPVCSRGVHGWCSPHELLGGLKESPGVWGNGGGVRIKEVCCHCGRRKLTDTWATNPCDGTQGHTSIEYFEPDDESLAWTEKHKR